MPTFTWNAHSEKGCLSCLSQVNDRGFVDTYAETNIHGDTDGRQIVGWADVWFCADCLHQMGRLVGMATPRETEAFAMREYELAEENEKLKDEVAAWQQRMENLIGLKVEELGLDMPNDEVLATTDAE